MVCSGGSCQVTFEDTVFDHCSLLVLSAAQATLSKAAFRDMGASQSWLGVLVHGASSRVAVQGGTVAGARRRWRCRLQAGGHLEATGLIITGVDAVGAEVQGEGSYLSLTRCEMHDFSVPVAGSEEAFCSQGVHVLSSSSARLSYLSVRGSKGAGVRVDSSASATLDGCTLSQGMTGLVVDESGVAHATKCHFRQNGIGAAAGSGGTLTAVACTSSRVSFKGFCSIMVTSITKRRGSLEVDTTRD